MGDRVLFEKKIEIVSKSYVSKIKYLKKKVV